MFNPRLRRLVTNLRARPYEPAVVGERDAPVTVELFADPFSDACEEFFNDTYERFHHRHVADEAVDDFTVRFEVRPVAAEMRMWTTAVASDVQRVAGAVDGDEQFTATDAAEFFHFVREHAGEDEFVQIVGRACRVAADDMMTYDRLRLFAEDVGVDPDEAIAAVERGEYRSRVRWDSERWIRYASALNLPAVEGEGRVFVEGEPVSSLDPETFSRQILSAQQLKEIEQQETKEGKE